MATLLDTSLTEAERRAVELFVERLRGQLGEHLVAVWLFGSSARGEGRREDSDVDLMVISTGGGEDERIVSRVRGEIAFSGPTYVDLAAHVWDPARLARRREIESFFVRELDRDKIVLHGEI